MSHNLYRTLGSQNCHELRGVQTDYMGSHDSNDSSGAVRHIRQSFLSDILTGSQDMKFYLLLLLTCSRAHAPARDQLSG